MVRRKGRERTPRCLGAWLGGEDLGDSDLTKRCAILVKAPDSDVCDDADQWRSPRLVGIESAGSSSRRRREPLAPSIQAKASSDDDEDELEGDSTTHDIARMGPVFPAVTCNGPFLSNVAIDPAEAKHFLSDFRVVEAGLKLKGVSGTALTDNYCSATF